MEKHFQEHEQTLWLLKKNEKKDSDTDGVSNINEIKAKSAPGDVKSTPQAPGDWLADADKIPVPKKELSKVFSNSDKYAVIEGSLNTSQISFVEKGLGQKILSDDKVPTFYFAIQGSKKVGVAQFINATGKIRNILQQASFFKNDAFVKAITGKQVVALYNTVSYRFFKNLKAFYRFDTIAFDKDFLGDLFTTHTLGLQYRFLSYAALDVRLEKNIEGREVEPVLKRDNDSIMTMLHVWF